jgi:hypothetical protein
MLEPNFARLALPVPRQAHGHEENTMKLSPVVRLLAFGFLLLMIPAVLSSPSSAQIGIGISVRIGPPALPVYEQPICPDAGYLWTPGYWAWDDDDGYYWVPGTWVEAPEPGLLWTPGYWGWNDGVYVWNAGYWGPHVGFYGGINYGFGYGGVGFGGGEWRGGTFFYNTAVMHVDTVHITNVYVNRTVIANNNSHVAFNGGQGGVAARPTAQEETYSREPHRAPVAAQVQQAHAARQNKALFASNNHGAPAVAATARPGEFSGAGVVHAKAAGAPYHAPAISPKEARASAPAGSRPASAEGAKPASRPAEEARPAAHPESAARPASAPRGETAARPAAHPESAPRSPSPAARPENAARPDSAPRSETTHPQSEAKAKSVPPARSAPHAQPAPKAKPAKPAPKPAPPKEEKKD